MVVEKKSFYPIFYSLITLCICLWLVPIYIEGDQEHYNLFFQNCILSDYSVADKFSCYSAYLDSQEPGYFIIINTLATLFNKHTIIIAADTLLAYLITRLIFLHTNIGYQRHILSILMVTNFYMLVLCLSAERLKFSLILLLLALLTKNIKNKYIFIFSSLMTHSQNIILFFSGFLSQIQSLRLSLWKKTALIFGGISLLLMIFYFNKEHILRKFSIYSSVDAGDFGINAVIKVSVLYIIAILSIRKWSVVLGGLPILLSSYLLGSSRIMILMFIFYIAITLYNKKKMDLIMFLVLCYFSYKSIGFIQNILIYGEGFNIS